MGAQGEMCKCDKATHAWCPDRRGLVECPHARRHARTRKCANRDVCTCWGITNSDGHDECLIVKCRSVK